MKLSVAVAVCLSSYSAFAQAINISPATVLRGDPVAITITDLEPRSLVTITAERAYGRSDNLYRSAGTYQANAEGIVDLAADRPISSMWGDADPTALFWSMRNTGVPADEDQESEEIRFSIDTDADGRSEAEATLRMRHSDDDLVQSPLGEAFPNAFIVRKPGSEPLPVIIVLGGSEGGDSAARDIAPRFASRGYAAIGLPYYGGGIEGLPQAFHNLPIDLLERVRDTLRGREDIIADRIGLYGVSKGAEFVLAAASRIDGFAAVAAIVPSDVIWQGWGTSEADPSGFSWRGEPLPFVPYLGMGTEFRKGGRGQKVAIRIPHDAGRLANPDRIEAARIRVVDIDEPVLVVGGDSDETWDSGGMARNIKERRDEAGLETVMFVSQTAGHALSGDAYTPTREIHADLRREAYPGMLRFFETHLKP